VFISFTVFFTRVRSKVELSTLSVQHKSMTDLNLEYQDLNHSTNDHNLNTP